MNTVTAPWKTVIRMAMRSLDFAHGRPTIKREIQFTRPLSTCSPPTFPTVSGHKFPPATFAPGPNQAPSARDPSDLFRLSASVGGGCPTAVWGKRVRSVTSAGVYLQSTLAAVWCARGWSKVAESKTWGARGMAPCPDASREKITPPHLHRRPALDTVKQQRWL